MIAASAPSVAATNLNFPSSVVSVVWSPGRLWRRVRKAFVQRLPLAAWGVGLFLFSLCVLCPWSKIVGVLQKQGGTKVLSKSRSAPNGSKI